MSRDMTKPTKWVYAQRRLRSAWASAQSDQSSLSAWRKLGSLATHWAHSEDSDQTGLMPRLSWIFAGRTLTLLVLSCRGSHDLRLDCAQILKLGSDVVLNKCSAFKLSPCIITENISVELKTRWGLVVAKLTLKERLVRVWLTWPKM